MKTHVLSPAEVALLRVSLEAAEWQSPEPADDPLSEAYAYYMGVRTTLASPDVVIAAVTEILRLREEVQALQAAYAARGQFYGRLVSDLTDGQRASAGGER